jgi:hypothetical protein
VCFSQDKESRFIACVTDENEPQLVFHDLKKNKQPVASTLETAVDKITINPEDTHTVAVTGDQFLKVFRVHESSVRPMGSITKLDLEQNFTDHEWLDGENLVVGTDKGRMYIVSCKDQKCGRQLLL